MPKDVSKVLSCRVCKNKNLKRVLSFGTTPPANAFLTKKAIEDLEPSFPLDVLFCKRCGLVQLGHVVSSDLLFRNYLYVSSTSPVFIRHFEEYAETLVKKFRLRRNSLVIDIGSNDGILLSPLKRFGVRVLGIDPAVKIARQATRQGLETWPDYFNLDTAERIDKTHGKASVITANNVFAHIPDIENVVNAVKALLLPNGVFVIEVPYLSDFIQKNLFDTVYHEHVSYFSLKPLTIFFKKNGMQVFDIERIDTHGGSIRIYVKKKGGKHKIPPNVKKLLKEETKLGLFSEKTFKDFARKIEENKKRLLKLLHSLKADGGKIVGYGAPAKGNTLLNYFGLDSSFLDYIVDDSPIKQGLYTPGTHIPVVAPNKLISSPPDYILILAWNFAQPIIDKLSFISERGGKFIIPVPQPSIVQDERYISKPIVRDDLKNIVDGIGKDAQKLAGKTLLISGGSGFLGSYINQTIKYLNEKVLRRECKVISIDNYITGSDKNNFLGHIDDPNFEFVYHDVRLPILIREDVDYIIHAAGLASPYYYQKYPLETIESAIIGAKNLLELSRLKKVKSFLFFSSSEIYGDPDPKFVPIPETYAGHVSSVGPRACYDESKRLGETICLVYHQQFGVPIKIVRPFNIYGPGMKIKDYRVVPTFLFKSLSGEALPVHGKGGQTRTFCYVTDSIISFLKVLLSGKDGEIYNTGNDQPEITMYELARKIVGFAGGKAKINLVEYPSSYPAGEPQRRCPDLSKIKSQLGYKPKVSLEEGLKRSIDWFRSEYKLY